MKKKIGLVILSLFFSLAILVGCEYEGIWFKASEGLIYSDSNQYPNLIRMCDTLERYEQFLHDYNFNSKKTYDEAFFVKNALIVYTFNNYPYKHTIDSVDVSNGVLEINIKRSDPEKELKRETVPFAFVIQVKKSVFAFDSIYDVKITYNDENLSPLETLLPEVMPEDFAFALKWSFTGQYDSSTKVVSDGYNFDLDMECKTELILDEEELQDIYTILRNVKVDTISDYFVVSYEMVVPAYNLVLEYRFGNTTKRIEVDGASHTRVEEWLENKDFGYAFYKIVDDYIKNSDEYKSLPENQLYFD